MDNEEKNSVLINQLKNLGDNNAKARIIDCVMYFSTCQDRKKCIKELKRLNFPMESYSVFDHPGGNDPFSLEICVSTTIEDEVINQITNILNSVAEKYDGVYDGWGSIVT